MARLGSGWALGFRTDASIKRTVVEHSAPHRHRQNSFRERRFVHAAGHPRNPDTPAGTSGELALSADERSRIRSRLGGAGTVGLRKAFIATLCELAAADDR